MGPDAAEATNESRTASRVIKRNSATRKEQNRNASRIYRERRKQRLALLDRLLEKDEGQALSASSQESTSTTDLALPELVDVQPPFGFTPTPLVQPSSSEHLIEGVGVAEPPALAGPSFDMSWSLSSNDPMWDFIVGQDGAAGTAQLYQDLSNRALSPSFILGDAVHHQDPNSEQIPDIIQQLQERQYPAATILSPASIFVSTREQGGATYVLGPSRPKDNTKLKAVASKAASPSASSRVSTTLVAPTRSAATTPSLPGEDSLGEFMQNLMNLRLPDVKQVIYVQQSGLFAAVMDNTLAIGVANGPQAVFADEAGSPFNRDWAESKGSMRLADIRSKFSGAPRDLQPVDVQITVEHHVYLDVIPFPSFRERALRAIAQDPPLLDEYELCHDICNREGMVVWGSQGNDRGMGSCRPWDMRSWEPKPWFLKKYHFLAGGWEDEMWRAARWWHMMRNERIAAGPASWAAPE